MREIGPAAGGRGRPATRYALTASAEGLFPKRYLELLDALLHAAQAEGLEEKLLDRVAQDMAEQVAPHLAGLAGMERLQKLLQLLDYGELLPEIESVPAGVCLHAHNCVYVDAGRHHEAVCDLSVTCCPAWSPPPRACPPFAPAASAMGPKAASLWWSCERVRRVKRSKRKRL